MVTKLCLVDTGFHADGIPRIPLLSTEPLSGYDMIILDWSLIFRGLLTVNTRNNCTMISKELTSRYWDIIRRRNHELIDFAKRGGTLVCVLKPVEEHIDCNNGKVSSLNWLPASLFSPSPIIPVKGNRFNEVSGGPFRDFIAEFGKDFAYAAAFTSAQGYPFLFTEEESWIVGSASKFGDGHIVFIPGFKPEIDERLSTSVYEDSDKRYVSKFIEEIIRAMDNVKRDGINNAPAWVEELELPMEAEVIEKIRSKEAQINELQREIDQLRNRLGDNKSWRELVYEKDEALKRVVSRSMEILGFRAIESKTPNGLTDLLFESPEGIVLCKVEGTDNTPIDKDQLLDLFRNTAEEIAQRDDDVSAVLIANAFRLQPLSQRKEQFSEPVVKIARRHNLGLMTSEELYHAVRHVLANPDDEDFKKSCRESLVGHTDDIISLKPMVAQTV